ncbi:MAG: RNA polymerase sigma factor [Lachnospiraceae bacterium]
MKRKDKQAEKCIEEILLENYDRYYHLAYSYTHNEADAQDIVQNGVYKAILYSDKLENIEYAKTWIYRIMLNETFDLLKKQRDSSLDELAFETGKEDLYVDIDLQRALNSMSKEDKAVIELRFFEDLKLSEIAEILGENISTIKSRLYRGLKKMKLELLDVWES